MRPRLLRLGRLASSLLLTLLVAASAVAVDIVVDRWGASTDLTEDDRLTLTDETSDILDLVDAPLSVEVFVTPDSPSGRDAAALADRYADANRRIDLEVVDPDAEPGRAERLGVTRFGTAVLRYEDRRVDVTTISEVELTSAILRLVRGRIPQACFVTGHGESSPDDEGPRGLSDLAGLVTRNGFNLDARSIGGDGLAGCDVVVIAGPRVPFADEETDDLLDHLADDGKVLLLADALSETDVNPITQAYGITFLGGVLLDNGSNFGNDVSTPIIVDFPSSSPIVTDVPSLLAPAAAGLLVSDQQPREGLFVSTLARSTDDAVLAADPEDPSAGGIPGPILVAAAADESSVAGDQPEISRTRLIVVADVALAENASLQALGNSTLLANGMSWLAQDELLLTVGTREPGFEPLVITPARRRAAFAVTVAGVPGAVLVAGMVTIVLRRRR